MASKKSKLDKATDIVAKIIKEQLDTLPSAVAKTKRKELHDLALRVSPSSGRGKRSQQPQSAGPRQISRSRANTA
jgi:hypothetical protein